MGRKLSYDEVARRMGAHHCEVREREHYEPCGCLCASCCWARGENPWEREDAEES